MTKEDKIKEAWGTLMPDYTRIDLDDGWSIGLFWCQDIDSDKYDTWDMSGCWCCIRPKSLQGIEDNNGWKRIEGQHDLPDIDTDYWVVYRGEVTKRAFNHHLPRSVKFWIENITHYQPIEKPLKPLY